MEHKAAESDSPLVSVLMPAYNAEKYIEKAIRSVIAQTVSDWELVIIDDYSQDRTCQIAEALARADARIRLYRNEQNQGAARTRNRGLDLCRGQYVALLDSDDVWYPEKLEKQLVLAQAENADIVYCAYAIVDENGQKRFHDFIVPEHTDLEATLVKSVISCSTALLGRNVTEHYRFPVEYYHEDLAMWVQLLGDGLKAVGTSQVLAEYRVRYASKASNKLSVAKWRWQIYRTLMGLSVRKSAVYFVQYAAAGAVKYRIRRIAG